MARLKNIIEAHKQDSLHLQRLYKRRERRNGKFKSTMGSIMGRE
jgi:hypothetical protein